MNQAISEEQEISKYFDSIYNGMIAVLVENSTELERVHAIVLERMRERKDISELIVFDPKSANAEYRDKRKLGKNIF